MDGLFDLDIADTGSLFDVTDLDTGTQPGLRRLGVAHQQVTYQPLAGGPLRTDDVFCNGPLDDTVWVIAADGAQIVVCTKRFRELEHTPKDPNP